MFACNGILFNHESPIRGETFVTRKITRAAVKIKLGVQKKLYLGNLDAKRDWGHAKDYVDGMWRMLQYENAEDFVLATGKTNTIREFCNLSFQELGIKINWKGKGENEVGLDASTGKEIILIDSNYYRPTEVDLLVGDASKAKKLLDWEPQNNLNSLIKEMINSDYKDLKNQYIAS